MFELPEFVTLARQINETLYGQEISSGKLGNSPHKFVWYNQTPEAFAMLVAGKRVGRARARGRWLLVPLEPGYMLVFGECGGKLIYQPANSPIPAKYHLFLQLKDGGFLWALTQMWGAYELYESGKEQNRQYIKDMRPTPIDATFTDVYFNQLLDTLILGEKRSVKSLLTADQLIPGLGNSSAQDIMFRARLHPRHPIADLSPEQRLELYEAILSIVGEIIIKGGRSDETDLYNRPGLYQRLMDSKTAGTPCPVCGTKIEKIQYLGGACYFCPNCQV